MKKMIARALPPTVLGFLLVALLSAPIIAGKDHVDYGPMAKLLPSNGEMYGWIKDLAEIGEAGEYGYRMPGTPADTLAINYVAEKFREFGLDTIVEPIPIESYEPDAWSLTIRAGGEEEQIPCSYYLYTPFTPAQGITAEMVYVGMGSEGDFAANDVAGKIVVVDILAPGIPNSFYDPITLFKYDPGNTLEGDMGTENWPIINYTSSMSRAEANGAIGFVGILTYTADHNNIYWFTRDAPLTALSLSPTDGGHLRSLLVSGASVEGTMVLTGYRGPGQSASIYGFLPGQNPDEIITVHTHHDAWATNEASGTAVVMGLAEYFSNFPQESREKTLLFIANGSHMAQKLPFDSLLDQLKDEGKIVWANVIEMIGKQIKIIDGKYVETGLISPTAYSTNAFAHVPVFAEAIVKYDLKRSSVLAAFVGGEGGGYARDGIPTVARIAENAPQFTNDDTPNTVQVDALKPTVAAFVDIINYVDGIPAGDL
jgi:aminopeptidase YwaD